VKRKKVPKQRKGKEKGVSEKKPPLATWNWNPQADKKKMHTGEGGGNEVGKGPSQGTVQKRWAGVDRKKI